MKGSTKTPTAKIVFMRVPSPCTGYIACSFNATEAKTAGLEVDAAAVPRSTSFAYDSERGAASVESPYAPACERDPTIRWWGINE